MPTSDPHPNLTWLIFSLMTVISWGVYGILLHSGQVGMSDPINGRYKAFLFVGIAYFLFAVLAPLGLLALNGASWRFPVAGMWWSLLAGIVGAIGAFCVLLAFGAKGSPAAVMSIVFGGAPIVNALVALLVHPPAGRLEYRALAVSSWHCAGRHRRLPRDVLQAPALEDTSRGGQWRKMTAVPKHGAPNGRAALEAEQLTKLRSLLNAIVPANAFYTAKLARLCRDREPRRFYALCSLHDQDRAARGSKDKSAVRLKSDFPARTLHPL